MSKIEFDLTGYYIKLVNPNIHISTKQAFSGIQPKNSETDYKNFSLSLLENNEIINDFEVSVFPTHPVLNEIKNKLAIEGAFYTSMTGTGSTIYGIFKDEPIETNSELTEKIIKL